MDWYWGYVEKVTKLIPVKNHFLKQRHVYFEYMVEWNFWIVTKIMAAWIANYQDVSQSNRATQILK